VELRGIGPCAIGPGSECAARFRSSRHRSGSRVRSRSQARPSRGHAGQRAQTPHMARVPSSVSATRSPGRRVPPCGSATTAHDGHEPHQLGPVRPGSILQALGFGSGQVRIRAIMASRLISPRPRARLQSGCSAAVAHGCAVCASVSARPCASAAWITLVTAMTETASAESAREGCTSPRPGARSAWGSPRPAPPTPSRSAHQVRARAVGATATAARAGHSGSTSRPASAHARRPGGP